MNKNVLSTKQCLACGTDFRTKANRVIFCSLRCRLQHQTSKKDECIEWVGCKDKDGYGRFRWNYKMWRSHVAAWTVEHGQVPNKLFVCHSCDNPSCINPNHLWLGTAADNAFDRDKKGRLRWNPKAGNNGRTAKRNLIGQFMCGV